MALEYDLILLGGSDVEQVAERALPDPTERPAGTPALLHSSGLQDRYGFNLSILGRESGYVAVEQDGGMWEFEPDAHVSLTFYLNKSGQIDESLTNMMAVIRRVLETGNEDALLILDGDTLLFTRFNGRLVKHDRPGFWDFYPAADSLLLG